MLFILSAIQPSLGIGISAPSTSIAVVGSIKLTYVNSISGGLLAPIGPGWGYANRSQNSRSSAKMTRKLDFLASVNVTWIPRGRAQRRDGRAKIMRKKHRKFNNCFG